MRVPAGGKISVQVNTVGVVPGTCLEAVRVPAWNDHGGAFCGNLRELFGYKPLQETDGCGFIAMSATQEEGPCARIGLGADFWDVCVSKKRQAIYGPSKLEAVDRHRKESWEIPPSFLAAAEPPEKPETKADKEDVGTPDQDFRMEMGFVADGIGKNDAEEVNQSNGQAEHETDGGFLALGGDCKRDADQAKSEGSHGE
jgi:hypothetical protein